MLEDVTAAQFFEVYTSNPLEFYLPSSVAAPSHIVRALIDAGVADHTSTVTCASKLIARHRGVSRQDVVVYSMAGSTLVGKLSFHCCVDGVLYSGVAPWPIISGTAKAWKCRVTSELKVLPSQVILESCIHSVASEGQVSHVLSLRY